MVLSKTPNPKKRVFGWENSKPCKLKTSNGPVWLLEVLKKHQTETLPTHNDRWNQITWNNDGLVDPTDRAGLAEFTQKGPLIALSVPNQKQVVQGLRFSSKPLVERFGIRRFLVQMNAQACIARGRDPERGFARDVPGRRSRRPWCTNDGRGVDRFTVRFFQIVKLILEFYSMDCGFHFSFCFVGGAIQTNSFGSARFSLSR